MGASCGTTVSSSRIISTLSCIDISTKYTRYTIKPNTACHAHPTLSSGPSYLSASLPRPSTLLHAHHKRPTPNTAHPPTACVQYGSLSYGCASSGGGVIGTTTKKTLVSPKKRAGIRRPGVGRGIGDEEAREDSER